MQRWKCQPHQIDVLASNRLSRKSSCRNKLSSRSTPHAIRIQYQPHKHLQQSFLLPLSVTMMDIAPFGRFRSGTNLSDDKASSDYHTAVPYADQHARGQIAIYIETPPWPLQNPYGTGSPSKTGSSTPYTRLSTMEAKNMSTLHRANYWEI